MIKDNLIKNLHEIYRQDKWINELLNSTGLTLDDINIAINDLEQQYWFDTITWAIPILEKILKFKTNSNSPIEERRSQLEARWKSNGKTDSDLIKAIVESFTKNLVEVSFDNRINICAVNQKSSNLIFSSLFNAIEEVKPAHLNYDLTLETRTKLNVKSKYLKNNLNYKITGNSISGSNTINKNNNKLYLPKLNLSSSYSTLNEPYILCGDFQLGEAYDSSLHTTAIQINSIYEKSNTTYKLCGDLTL
jgi:hypothetical protein